MKRHSRRVLIKWSRRAGIALIAGIFFSSGAIAYASHQKDIGFLSQNGHIFLGTHQYKDGMPVYCIEAGAPYSKNPEGDWHIDPSSQGNIGATLIHANSSKSSDLIQASVQYAIHEHLESSPSSWDQNKNLPLRDADIAQVATTAHNLWNTAENNTPIRADIKFTKEKNLSHKGTLSVSLINHKGENIPGINWKLRLEGPARLLENIPSHSQENPSLVHWEAQEEGKVRAILTYQHYRGYKRITPTDQNLFYSPPTLETFSSENSIHVSNKFQPIITTRVHDNRVEKGQIPSDILTWKIAPQSANHYWPHNTPIKAEGTLWFTPTKPSPSTKHPDNGIPIAHIFTTAQEEGEQTIHLEDSDITPEWKKLYPQANARNIGTSGWITWEWKIFKKNQTPQSAQLLQNEMWSDGTQSEEMTHAQLHSMKPILRTSITDAQKEMRHRTLSLQQRNTHNKQDMYEKQWDQSSSSINTSANNHISPHGKNETPNTDKNTVFTPNKNTLNSANTVISDDREVHSVKGNSIFNTIYNALGAIPAEKYLNAINWNIGDWITGNKSETEDSDNKGNSFLDNIYTGLTVINQLRNYWGRENTNKEEKIDNTYKTNNTNEINDSNKKDEVISLTTKTTESVQGQEKTTLATHITQEKKQKKEEDYEKKKVYTDQNSLAIKNSHEDTPHKISEEIPVLNTSEGIFDTLYFSIEDANQDGKISTEDWIHTKEGHGSQKEREDNQIALTVEGVLIGPLDPHYVKKEIKKVADSQIFQTTQSLDSRLPVVATTNFKVSRSGKYFTSSQKEHNPDGLWKASEGNNLQALRPGAYTFAFRVENKSQNTQEQTGVSSSENYPLATPIVQESLFSPDESFLITAPSSIISKSSLAHSGSNITMISAISTGVGIVSICLLVGVYRRNKKIKRLRS